MEDPLMKRIQRPLCSEHIKLPVADADRIIAALYESRVIRRLGGQERQLVTDALIEITKAREQATSEVELSHESCISLLRCISATQTWWAQMLDEFGSNCADDA